MQVEFAGALPIQKRLLFLAHDLEFHADLLEIVLHVFADGPFLRIVGIIVDGDGALLAVLVTVPVLAHAPASLLHQFIGFHNVVGAYRKINVAIRNGLGHQRVGYRFRTVKYTVGNGLLVYGVLERLAHVDVPGNRLMRVQKNGPGGDGVADLRLVRAFLLQRGKRVEIQHVTVGTENKIDFPLLECEQNSLMVRHNLPAYALQSRLRPPIAFISREHGILLVLVLGQNPRPRADITGHAVLGFAINETFRRDETERPGQPQLYQRRVVGMLEHQLVGIFVNGLIAVDFVDHVQPRVPGKVAHYGVHIRFDGLGVERRSIREGNIFPEMEGVFLPIRRDFPAFREPGFDALLRIDDQRFEHHVLRRHLTGIQMRVDVSNILCARVRQFRTRRFGFGGRLLPRAPRKPQECDNHDKQFSHEHDSSPFTT